MWLAFCFLGTALLQTAHLPTPFETIISTLLTSQQTSNFILPSQCSGLTCHDLTHIRQEIRHPPHLASLPASAPFSLALLRHQCPFSCQRPCGTCVPLDPNILLPSQRNHGPSGNPSLSHCTGSLPATPRQSLDSFNLNETKQRWRPSSNPKAPPAFSSPFTAKFLNREIALCPHLPSTS